MIIILNVNELEILKGDIMMEGREKCSYSKTPEKGCNICEGAIEKLEFGERYFGCPFVSDRLNVDAIVDLSALSDVERMQRTL